MLIIVSKRDLLDRIADAGKEEQGLAALRDFIFDYYWDEDEYVFESEESEWIFAVLLPYLQVEEAIGDPHRQERMRKLLEALGQEFTPESAVIGLEYDCINDLVQKYRNGFIRRHLLRKKIEELTPAAIDKEKLFKAVMAKAEESVLE